MMINKYCVFGKLRQLQNKITFQPAHNVLRTSSNGLIMVEMYGTIKGPKKEAAGF